MAFFRALLGPAAARLVLEWVKLALGLNTVSRWKRKGWDIAADYVTSWPFLEIFRANVAAVAADPNFESYTLPMRGILGVVIYVCGFLIVYLVIVFVIAVLVVLLEYMCQSCIGPFPDSSLRIPDVMANTGALFVLWVCVGVSTYLFYARKLCESEGAM